MGLGSVKDSGSENGTFLVIAGGFIWNKKADKSDPNYTTQEWVNQDKETKVREGAQYANLTGRIISAWTKTHEQYGEALYVKLDSDGEIYVLNIKTNSGNSQQMMKAMLLMDLDKDIFINPYDFVDKTSKKRVQGISFKQDGEKIDLKRYDAGADWKTEKDFWLPSNKKRYMRWLEDFSDFLISEIEEKIVSELDIRNPKEKKDDVPKVAEKQEVVELKKEETATETLTPLKMKKALKEYIKENYPENELPTLTKEEVKVWYDLSQDMEELPFENEFAESNESESEVDEDDIQAQLDALAG